MNARTRTGKRLLGGLIAVVAATALAAPTAFAASPGGGGGGSGGGGSGGGGSGGGGGTTTGSVYSDLVIALRAPNGTPVLTKYVVPATAETAAAVEYCVQPVSYRAVPGVTSSTNPVDGRTVWVVPLQGAEIVDNTVPADFTGACDAQPEYAMFITEVELERLNLARTADDVIAQKIADVQLKLMFADAIALESTGRITYDDVPIDASPENAAMYQSLMKTGTVPGLPVDLAGPPAEIGPTPADATSNSRFDAWELAAMTIGAGASKSTPLTLDAVEYYNRAIGFPPTADPTAIPPVPEYISPWGVDFVRSADPDNPASELAGSEQFVDYSGFSYNRSETFKGSITWLDVPTLTWKVSKITDVVPFTNLSSYGSLGTNTLTGITAFAQLADDVRALCNFIPDNTFLPGFFMDRPGQDTTTDQLNAIHDPAVDLGTLPTDVFQGSPFEMTASLLNPFGGDLIDKAQLRLRIDATDPFTAGSVTAVSTADGQSIPFTVDANGDLVGKWGPDSGFPVWPGYNVSTTFTATVAVGAPTGAYSVTLALIDLDDPGTVLADETGSIAVHASATTLLWGSPLPKYTTQGSATPLPLQVYSPEAGTAELTLVVTGPAEDPATIESEALAAGDLKVYGSNGTDMVPMPITLSAEGNLVGTWTAALTPGYTAVTWYVTVAEGAPVGSYAFGAGLVGGNTLAPISIVVFAPEAHGEQPPTSGEDTTAPLLTVTPLVASGSTVEFTLTADESPVDFSCMLTTNGVDGGWAACTSPKAYSNLAPADYVFSAKATDKALNESQVVTRSWTVGAGDSTPPVVTLITVGTPDSAASFTFTTDETDVTFECMLAKDAVAGAWAACTSPKTYSGLTAGTYVFSVRATDTAGNTSEVSSSDAWTIAPADDTTPPVVTITAVGTPGANAQFTLGADESDVTFECQLTKNTRVSKAWAACTSPVTYTKLTPATYVLSVRATDKASNVSSVETVTWTVVKATGKSKATPKVSSTQPAAVEPATVEPEPATVEPEPATAEPGTVAPAEETTPLQVTITAVETPGADAEFTLSADASDVTFECQLTKNTRVSKAWEPCTSPVTYTRLTPATYVLSVRANDEAGNVSTEETVTWTVVKGTGKAK